MNDLNITIKDLWARAKFDPNDNQRDAILHTDGPLYLPAGPGSGKTRVLLWRAVNLIVFHGVNPDDIFLSTFTEKAAHQLKEGLRSLLGDVTNQTGGEPYDLSRMYLGTIHSLCQKLITDRRFSGDRRRNQRPSLLDALGQYFFISAPWRWSELSDDFGWGTEPEEIHRQINAAFEKKSESKHQAIVNCIALFNRFSEEMIDPTDALERANDDVARVRFLEMYDRYQRILSQDGQAARTDFSLLQQEAYRVLMSFAGAGSVFKHVIIDEYQDTNAIQEAIIFRLGQDSKNICVVGDDDQALYRFRGATVENFVDFPEKCVDTLGVEPEVLPLDINYRSRQKIVSLYSQFIGQCDWRRTENHHLLHRVAKNITAHRADDAPAVVASTPGRPEEVCRQVAELVKGLLDEKKVEDPNQIAFLFPSLKTEQVPRMKSALEAVGLKVYAPRAGRFLDVDEAVALFGVFLQIFGKPPKGDYPGHDYTNYFLWIDRAAEIGKDLLAADKALAQFVRETRDEIATAVRDYELLLGLIHKKGWSLEDPYDLALMKRELYSLASISLHAKRNISNKYFDQVVKEKAAAGNPYPLKYVLARTTSLDWNVLDLFYKLCAFDAFKSAFDLAEAGTDEGPICNLSLISQYLARFIDQYRGVISADVLLDDRFQRRLFASYLYAIYRLGESEYEDAEDPFPKGRIPFLTIHQAKGLEFPVVVFGNPRKSNQSVQPTESLVHPLLTRQGEPLEKMPQFDMMRLFYVALSRAENLLIIPHWKSTGNFVSSPLKELLTDDYVARIPTFDLHTLPAAQIEKSDLPKNYAYTSDYLQYLTCPRNYMIFRRYNFAASRSETMFFGSLVHQTLEDLHQHLIAMRTTA